MHQKAPKCAKTCQNAPRQAEYSKTYQARMAKNATKYAKMLQRRLKYTKIWLKSTKMLSVPFQSPHSPFLFLLIPFYCFSKVFASAQGQKPFCLVKAMLGPLTFCMHSLPGLLTQMRKQHERASPLDAFAHHCHHLYDTLSRQRNRAARATSTTPTSVCRRESQYH